jgi:5-methylcytosine-specific restriction endonuclease McrA
MLTGDAKRRYQREWVAKRRAAWFAGKQCVDCGSTENLELDHVSPAEKLTHRVWSFSWKRIEEETKKCVVRCHACHLKKTDSNNERAKITEQDEDLIIELRSKGYTYKDIHFLYGFSEDTISRVTHR